MEEHQKYSFNMHRNRSYNCNGFASRLDCHASGTTHISMESGSSGSDVFPWVTVAPSSTMMA